MKRRDMLKELRGLSASDLQARAKKTAEEAMKLRFRKASGQLEQSHRLGQLQRELARVLTCLKEAKRQAA